MTGKIELIKSGKKLPGYEPPNNQKLTETYPFRLITAPARFILNSNFAQLDAHREKANGPYILVDPDDLKQKELVNGSWAEVYNQYGSCLLKVKASEYVPSGVVIALDAWWCQDLPGKRNINAVIGDKVTDLGEGSTFYNYNVNIRKI
ncbi:MAG: hypothetical protein PWP31_1207 [Clostridia bacterium]|nr:hypothetical protein [Clostridia bacterium]